MIQSVKPLTLDLGLGHDLRVMRQSAVRDFGSAGSRLEILFLSLCPTPAHAHSKINFKKSFFKSSIPTEFESFSSWFCQFSLYKVRTVVIIFWYLETFIIMK